MADSQGFSRDLYELMQFPSEGIFSTVLAKSDTYNYTLMCLAKGTDIDTHTSKKKWCCTGTQWKRYLQIVRQRDRNETRYVHFYASWCPPLPESRGWYSNTSVPYIMNAQIFPQWIFICLYQSKIINTYLQMVNLI